MKNKWSFECPSCAPVSGPTEKSCLHGTLDNVSVNVIVETAIGKALPVPKLVTEDFERTIRVEIDTSGATTRTVSGEAGDFPVSGKASFHLTQTAADYVHNADNPCPV